MELFYSGHIEGDTITLDHEESRHIKVMRLRNGDMIHVTDGNGKLYHAKISGDDPREVIATIISTEQKEQRSFGIHLAIAPTKNIDRFEWFLEKATEIGIDEITPILCRYSERTVLKTERLHRILVSAMKQSNQFHLPKLNELSNFNDVILKSTEDNKFIAHCYEGSKTPLWKSSIHGLNTLVLIGPEGDFSKEEVETAISSGYKPVTLGNTRLRTETAGLSAVQTIHFMNEINGKA